MSLIKCPECGKEISDKAAACPNCGCPLHSTPTPPTAQNLNNVQRPQYQNTGNNIPQNNNRVVQPQQAPTPIHQNTPSQKPPLTERTWFLVVMCICFPPIGIALLWIKKRPQNMVLRVIITVYLGIVTLYTFSSMINSPDNSQELDTSASFEETATTVTNEADSQNETVEVNNSTEETVDSETSQESDKAYEVIEKPSEDAIQTLSRRTLHNEIDNLENNWVRTAGAITAVNTDENNHTFINMNGKSEIKLLHFYLMTDQDVSSLSEGSYVTVVGRVDGKILGQAIIENCYIENVGDAAKELDETLIANDGISGGDTVFGTSELNKNEAISITAKEVYKELNENQVACKNKYDGKIVAITGTIDDIGTNIYGQEYVTLNTGEEYSLTGVQCFFKNDQMDYVASLKKGDKVTLYGVASIGSMTFKVAECRP